MIAATTLRFEHAFNAEWLDVLPWGTDLESLLKFPSDGRRFSFDTSVFVRFESAQRGFWIGQFRRYQSEKGLSGAFSTPNINKACIIAGGAGYFVNVDDPSKSSLVERYPVTSVLQGVPQNLLLLSTAMDITAYDRSGIVWWTDLSLRDLRMVGVKDNCVVSIGSDGVTSSIFEVNIEDGRLQSEVKLSSSSPSCL